MEESIYGYDSWRSHNFMEQLFLRRAWPLSVSGYSRPFLWDPIFHYRVRKRPPLDTVLNLSTPVIIIKSGPDTRNAGANGEEV
jgi:hypothetical protein